MQARKQTEDVGQEADLGSMLGNRLRQMAWKQSGEKNVHTGGTRKQTVGAG